MNLKMYLLEFESILAIALMYCTYMNINLFFAFSAYILWGTGPPPETRDLAIPASLLSLGLHIRGEGGHQKRPLHTVPGHQENEVQHRISNSKLFDNSVAKKNTNTSNYKDTVITE